MKVKLISNTDPQTFQDRMNEFIKDKEIVDENLALKISIFD